MMHLPCRYRDDDYRTSGSSSAPQPIERRRSRQARQADTYGTPAPYQVERPRSAFYTPLEDEKSVIPDNPFQQPAPPPPPVEEPVRRPSFVAEDGSEFEAPAMAQLPEWYRVAQHNAMPADDRRRHTPQVQRASQFEEEVPETPRDPLGRPMRRPVQAQAPRRDSTMEDFYEQAGYPRELILEQQRLSEEQARMRSRRTHGAMQAAPRQPDAPRQRALPGRPPMTEAENQRRAAAVENYARQRDQYVPSFPEDASVRWDLQVAEREEYERTQRARQAQREEGYAYRRHTAPAYDQPENDMVIEEYIDEDAPFWKNIRLWLGVAVAVLALAAAGLFAMEAKYTAKTRDILAKREQSAQAIQDKYFIKYKDWIDREAAKNNLNPAFVAAIIFNESTFRPGVESSVGARGLMQIMVDTSGDIAEDLGYENYSPDMLYDPETNIIFGCYYLGQLSQRFRGDPVCVAAAYHAGAQQVQNWLNTSRYSADGQTLILANMNDGPTTQYAARVSRDFAIYRQLYYDHQEGTK